jgi:hypothetical protein
MEFLHHVARRMLEKLVLEFIDIRADLLQHRVIMVDDRIDQHMGQIVRLGLSNHPPPGSQPFAHLSKDVVIRFLLNGDEHIFREKKVHLLANNCSISTNSRSTQ